MKSVLLGVRDAACDAVVGVFLLILCGVSTACGRAPEEIRPPQERVDAVSVDISPMADGVLHFPAPTSYVQTTAVAPTGFEVDAEPGEAAFYSNATAAWVPLDQSDRSYAFTTQAAKTKAWVTSKAMHPMQYELKFTPTLTVDGVKYSGQSQYVRYCLGD